MTRGRDHERLQLGLSASNRHRNIFPTTDAGIYDTHPRAKALWPIRHAPELLQAAKMLE